MNAWFGEARALFEDPGRILEAGAKRLESLERIEPEAALPWVFTGALSIPVALLIGVPTSGLGIGLFIGTLIAIAIAWHAHRQARRHAEDLARVIAQVHADADRRVEIVTRQYEWAVNDVANLRDALRRTQAAPQARGQRWAERMKREAQPARRAAVPLTSAIHADGSLTSVRFDAKETIPTQVRIVDERGAVVAISARAVEPGASSFVLRISRKTADALLHEDGGELRVEALVDEQWLAADMRSAERPGESDSGTSGAGAATDKRGRVWGVAG